MSCWGPCPITPDRSSCAAPCRWVFPEVAGGDRPSPRGIGRCPGDVAGSVGRSLDLLGSFCLSCRRIGPRGCSHARPAPKSRARVPPPNPAHAAPPIWKVHLDPQAPRIAFPFDRPVRSGGMCGGGWLVGGGLGTDAGLDSNLGWCSCGRDRSAPGHRVRGAGGCRRRDVCAGLLALQRQHALAAAARADPRAVPLA